MFLKFVNKSLSVDSFIDSVNSDLVRIKYKIFKIVLLFIPCKYNDNSYAVLNYVAECGDTIPVNSIL